MRTICTLLSIVLLMGSLKAQQSIASATKPSDTWGTPIQITTGNGFSMINAGSGTMGNFQGGSNASVLSSPIYFYNSARSYVVFGMNLRSLANASNGTSRINSYTISIVSGVGGGNQQTGTYSGPAIDISNEAKGTNYYFTISGISIPTSTNFYIKLQLNIQNGNADIVSSAFETNAFFAPLNSVLPLKFGAFTAKSFASVVNLNWTIDAEENTKGYHVERSTDGRSYNIIGSVTANGSRSYNFTDASPAASAHYRIKAWDNDGKFGYSQIVMVKGNESQVAIKAFFSNKDALAIHHDQVTEGARIIVCTADGKILRSQIIAAGAQQTMVDVSAARAGILLVRFETAKGQLETLKLVKP
jgi:hypothetical protein